MMNRVRRSFWVLLFLATAIAELIKASDKMVNGTRNDTSSALADTPQGNNNMEVGNKTTNTAVVNNRKNRYNGGGGAYGWGWGGGGGGGGGGGKSGSGGGGGGEWGWGWGGGGGGYYKWGCGGNTKGGRRGINNQVGRKRVYTKEYKIGEFAECMNRGRCRGMRLDCPLHCGGPCFYDCHYMCKAHCRRS